MASDVVLGLAVIGFVVVAVVSVVVAWLAIGLALIGVVRALNWLANAAWSMGGGDYEEWADSPWDRIGVEISWLKRWARYAVSKWLRFGDRTRPHRPDLDKIKEIRQEQNNE